MRRHMAVALMQRGAIPVARPVNTIAIEANFRRRVVAISRPSRWKTIKRVMLVRAVVAIESSMDESAMAAQRDNQ